MEDVITLNQDVTIVAYYFKDKDQPKCFPKRMEYEGKQVVFTRLACATQHTRASEWSMSLT